jgi:drug/metabolite transporter (DMT)-like permease
MTRRIAVHSMTFNRYLVLLAIVLGSTLGDVFLSRGMREIGEVSAARWRDLLFAPLHPWVALGIALLITFFVSYTEALSWADLSFIMPATAFGTVLTALFARFFLNESIPATRWAGIVLITLGVGFVSRGPSLTLHADASGAHLEASPPAAAAPEEPA